MIGDRQERAGGDAKEPIGGARQALVELPRDRHQRAVASGSLAIPAARRSSGCTTAGAYQLAGGLPMCEVEPRHARLQRRGLAVQSRRARCAHLETRVRRQPPRRARAGAALGPLVVRRHGRRALWLLAEAVLRLFFDGVARHSGSRTREIGETYTPSIGGSCTTRRPVAAYRCGPTRSAFAGRTGPSAKPAGVRRIAVLGDSMVAGLAVPEPETMCGVLETLLNGEPEPRVEVMNFGISASAPAQELALYRGLVRRFAPDVVVLTFFSGNDLSDTLYEISDRYGRMYVELDADGRLRPREYTESPRRRALAREESRVRVDPSARREGASDPAEGPRIRSRRAPRLLSGRRIRERRRRGVLARSRRRRVREATVRADGAEPRRAGHPELARDLLRDLEELREWAGPGRGRARPRRPGASHGPALAVRAFRSFRSRPAFSSRLPRARAALPGATGTPERPRPPGGGGAALQEVLAETLRRP